MIEVSPVVRAKALVRGASRWLDGLDSLVADLQLRVDPRLAHARRACEEEGPHLAGRDGGALALGIARGGGEAGEDRNRSGQAMSAHSLHGSPHLVRRGGSLASIRSKTG